MKPDLRKQSSKEDDDNTPKQTNQSTRRSTIAKRNSYVVAWLKTFRNEEFLRELATENTKSLLQVDHNVTNIYRACSDISFVNNSQLRTTPGDGNCLFHAVSFGVAAKFTTNAQDLRCLTADFMTSNFEALYKLFGFVTRDAFRVHISNTRRNGVYGEVYEVYCLASLLNASIKVLYGTECIHFSPNIHLTTTKLLDLPYSSIYLRLKNEHYDVYLPK